MKRRVLGLSCDNADGNAGVLLDAALMAAEADGAEVRVLRADTGAPGLCPLCHLDDVVVRPDHVAYATCGARGELVVEGGAPVSRFPGRGLAESVLTMTGKRAHVAEGQATAARLRSRAADIEARAAAYAAFDRRVQPRPATAGS